MSLSISVPRVPSTGLGTDLSVEPTWGNLSDAWECNDLTSVDLTTLSLSGLFLNKTCSS